MPADEHSSILVSVALQAHILFQIFWAAGKNCLYYCIDI